VGCGNSFTASTKVLLANGKLKAIKDIALGDKVRATDARTGKSSARVVTNLIRHSGLHAMVLVAVVGGGAINATDGHPFYEAKSGQFVKASELTAGDRLRLDDGRMVRVASTTAYADDLTAYNLAVDVDHTYYVSDDAGDTVLVHNSSCTINPGGSGPGGRWKVGDDYSIPTMSGNAPAWSTVRSRFWKNEANETLAEQQYGASNVDRMKKGLAPQRVNDDGVTESMELSHEPLPQREGGTLVTPRWPDEHALIDPFRRLKGQ
jgi:hypothetical protein